MSIIDEFKKFISRGNVIDLAVGIIIGTAFTAIVNSFVKDIITPPIGAVTSGVDFKDHFIVLSGGEYTSLEEAEKAGAATLNYGRFLNNIIYFFIVSVAVFILVKQVNRFTEKKEAEEKAAPAPPARQEVLLEEIRDLLKEKNQ